MTMKTTYLNNIKNVFPWITLMVLLAIAGCATLLNLPNYRDYEGEALPGEKVAYITHEDPYSQYILIREIDNIKTYWIIGVIELKPGRHTITCTYAKTRHDKVHSSAKPVTFTFDVKAGKIYAMKIEESIDMESGRKWRLKLVDITDDDRHGKYKAAFDEIANYKQKIKEGKALDAVRGNTTEPAPLK